MRVYRPFVEEEFLKVNLPASVRKVIGVLGQVHDEHGSCRRFQVLTPAYTKTSLLHFHSARSDSPTTEYEEDYRGNSFATDRTQTSKSTGDQVSDDLKCGRLSAIAAAIFQLTHRETYTAR